MRIRDPRSLTLLAFGLALLVGCTWGLPGSDSWAADSISPRSCGLGAVVENFVPGHFQHYPPLHMALLTVLSLPWMAAAALHVGADVDALGQELIRPLYMTGVEASARIVAALMAFGILWNLSRFWTRIAGARAGTAAMVIAATNAAFVYYGHTGNLEVPALFWITWALVELDRVADGEPRERQALLLTVAAALTKDQAVGALAVPVVVYLLVVPWAMRRQSIVRRPVLVAGLIALGAYLAGSGALENPIGFSRRVQMLLGPAAHSWAAYPKGLAGSLALTRDALLATTEFTSWPVAIAAAIGLVLAVTSGPRLTRLRALAPFLAALSFTYLFNYGARRTDTRFLLPQSLLLFPYAAITWERVMARWPKRHLVIAVASLTALAPAIVRVISMDATLLADPRYEAERFLATLPKETHVEIYGGPIFLPRLPATLQVVRPGIEPVGDRQLIPGVTELVDPLLDLRSRHPAVVVLATELSTVEMTKPRTAATPYGLMQYRDDVSRSLFEHLSDGSLGYTRVLRATCSLPWPLECIAVHGSTAGEMWIYEPTASSR